jgi:hypothetical protein
MDTLRRRYLRTGLFRREKFVIEQRRQGEDGTPEEMAARHQGGMFEQGIHGLFSATGFGEQRVETLRQLLGQILEKIAWDQSHLNEIAQVQPILIAIGQQFHLH